MKLFKPKFPTIRYRDADKLPTTNRLTELKPKNWDVTLSMSFLRERYFPGLIVACGKRSGIDIDNCFDVTIEGLTINPDGAKHGIRISDHSNNVWLDSVAFETPSRSAEIVIGGRPGIMPTSTWHAAGTVTLRNVRSSYGRPVRVLVLDAKPPVVIDSDVEIRLVNPRYIRAAKWLNTKGLLP